MSVVPSGQWYADALATVREQQAGVTDYLGRPWADHFERVALRLVFRNPAATRQQIEAALLHDVFMDRGGGHALLRPLGVAPRGAEIFERTPPPAAEIATYLDYVRYLVASGDLQAAEMKLADINDTIDACRQGATPVLIDQFHHRYEPSRRLLEAALSPGLV